MTMRSFGMARGTAEYSRRGEDLKCTGRGKAGDDGWIPIALLMAYIVRVIKRSFE